MNNLIDDVPVAGTDESFMHILTRPGVRIERIVSYGQVTPEGEPYDQPHDEWVLLLAGAARLWIEGSGEHALNPGDHLLIPAHARHRVTWTDPLAATVWLAVHFDGDRTVLTGDQAGG